jgi:hypothetical protein
MNKLNELGDFSRYFRKFFKTNLDVDLTYLEHRIKTDPNLHMLLKIDLEAPDLSKCEDRQVFRHFEYLLKYYFLEEVQKTMNSDFKLIDFEAIPEVELLQGYSRPTEKPCDVCSSQVSTMKCLPFFELHANHKHFTLGSGAMVSEVALCENCFSQITSHYRHYSQRPREFEFEFDDSGLPF